jgi:hypothetical protein
MIEFLVEKGRHSLFSGSKALGLKVRELAALTLEWPLTKS